MTKNEIVSKVKELNFPEGSFIVFGSCPLAAAGIREANDIDLLVSEEVFAKLQRAGWQTVNKGPDDNPLTRDIYEAHKNWNFSSYSPTLEHLLSTATIIEGVPFASLEEVRKWKSADNIPKHLADIELINAYLKSNN